MLVNNEVDMKTSLLQATIKSAIKSKSKKTKKVTLPAQVSASKNLGRWKPQDDLLLIEAVMQVSIIT